MFGHPSLGAGYNFEPELFCRFSVVRLLFQKLYYCVLHYPLSCPLKHSPASKLELTSFALHITGFFSISVNCSLTFVTFRRGWSENQFESDEELLQTCSNHCLCYVGLWLHKHFYSFQLHPSRKNHRIALCPDWPF